MDKLAVIHKVAGGYLVELSGQEKGTRTIYTDFDRVVQALAVYCEQCNADETWGPRAERNDGK